MRMVIRRPQRVTWQGLIESRTTVTLVRGQVVKRETTDVQFRETWLDVGEGDCRHVSLSSKTRGAVKVTCPDCRPPDPQRIG